MLIFIFVLILIHAHLVILIFTFNKLQAPVQWCTEIPGESVTAVGIGIQNLLIGSARMGG